MKKIITLLSAVIIGFSGFSQTYIDEDFSTFINPVLPPLASGWKSVDSIPNRMSDSIWRFDNPGTPVRSFSNPITAPFAIADGDWTGTGFPDDTYLSSTNFDASAALVVVLEFDHYFRAIGTGGGEIQIFDGVNWISDTIYTVTTAGGVTTQPFPSTHEVIDISQYVAGVPNAQVRFRFIDPGWGWYWAIDNVTIFQPTPDDASVVSVNSLPDVACSLDTNESICATIVNAGSTTLRNIPIRYTINGGSIIPETIADSILPGDTLIYCFNTTANISAAGTYDIAIFTAVRGDVISANDSAFWTTSLISAITSYPYSEGFETGNGGWTAGGNGSTWANGAPGGAIITSAATGVNAYVTNLTGDYSNSEESFVLSPCFDFSSLNAPQFKMNIWWETENSWDGAVLEMTIDDGITWTQVGALGNPNNWYTDGTINGLTNQGLTGEGWSGDAGNLGSQGWVLAEHDLPSAANQPSVKLRVVFGSDGSVTREGIGFDDVLIQDAPAIDVGVTSLVSPGNSCGFGTTDSIVIAIANFGSAAINNIPVEFELFGFAPVLDTVRSSINPGDTTLFTFTTGTVNLSIPGIYNFSIYSSLQGDGNILNDSASAIVENSLKTAPYAENFDAFNLGTALQNGWTSTTTTSGGFGSYLWQVNSGQTGSFATGPVGDNTTGSANYIYTEASNGSAGDITSLTSPCIGVAGLTGASLEFYYHMTGTNINTLYIELLNDNGLFIIDSIVGQQQAATTDPFNLRVINLATYLGAGNISINFRTFKTSYGGDVSIDDFRVFEPSARDVSLIEITAPQSNCGLSATDSVKVLITNVGTAAIDSIPVVYEDRGNVVVDTSFGLLNVGDTTEFTFSTTVDFSMPGTYNILAYSDLLADGDRSRDSSRKLVENSLKVAPYTENFDLMPLGNVLNNGWANGTNGAYDWRINSGQTGSINTGPSADNTTGFGNYIYTEASNGAAGQIATLESPCIDASGLSGASVEFYYHMFGAEINTLYIEVGNNNGYTVVDSIVGAQQLGTPDPFIKRAINISSYLGAGNLSVRFSSVSLGCCGGDISIDDFRIFEPSFSDAAVLAITEPNTGCGLGSDSIKILLQNVGLGTLDTIPVSYTINGGGVIVDTSFTSLIPGNSSIFTFGVPANLTAFTTYAIVAYSDLGFDGDRNNDTTASSIVNVPVVSIPYTESFETSTGGWTAYGTNSSWAWGTPGGTIITSAGSGNQAWVTNLTGVYNNNENSYLESPCMDFATQSNDPTLTYLQVYNTESCCDEGWVELSLDGGVTWNKLIDNGGAFNWYNDIFGQYWNGDNLSGLGVWDTVSNVLTGAAGQSSVKVRIAFSSDGSVTEEGFGIDSVSIDVTTSLAQNTSQALTFSIYPNPSTGEFTLVAPKSKESINIEVFDTKGQLIYNGVMTAASARINSIDLSKNAKGVYFVKISNGNSSKIEKLILQ